MCFKSILRECERQLIFLDSKFTDKWFLDRGIIFYEHQYQRILL